MKQAPENRIFVETIARLVSQKGLELERTLMSIDTNFNGENFRFLCNSDPSHVFYKQKLNEYLNSKNQEDDDYEEEADFPSPPSRHRYLSFRCPNSITRKDLNIIKLTAQFVARYGMYFVQGLREKVANKPQFEFLKPMDIWFSFYNGLVRAYSTVLRPCSDESMMMIDVAFVGVFEVFFNRLQLEKLEEGDVMAMIDLHAFLSGVDSFAYMDDQDFHASYHRLRPTSNQSDAMLCLTHKELCVFKVTAQFEARYGMEFMRALMTRVAVKTPQQFEFMEATSGRRFDFYSQIVESYSRILMPCKKLDADTVLEGFFHLVDCFQQEGVDFPMGLVDAVDCFAHMNGVISPLHNNNITLVYTGQAYVQCPPPSMQPEPKRRRTVSEEIHSEGDTGY